MTIRDKEIVRKVSAKGFDMNIKLHWLDGNPKPYFSITGAKWRKTKSGKRDKRYTNPMISGAIGDEFVKVMPSYADIAEYHCRNIDGTPMYPLANGLYHLGFNKEGIFEREPNIKYTMSHLDITETEANELYISMKQGNPVEKLKVKIAELQPIWEDKARQLLAKYFDITETDFNKIMADFPAYKVIK